MKALVLGATGHIGNAVVRELLSRGYEVTAASRRPEPAINLAGLPVVYARGDIDAPGQLDAWIAGHDIVIDAAAPYVSQLITSNKPAETPLDHAARRTTQLLQAVRVHRCRLAYVSSFVTLPCRRTGLERSQSELVRWLHPYFAVKALIESQILLACQTGLAVTIVNPTLCLGPWDLKTRDHTFVPRLLSGEPAAAMDHMVNVIDVREVATTLVAALEGGHFGKPTLISGHNISNEALFRWICELGGDSPPRLVASTTLSLLATYGLEAGLAMYGAHTTLPALAPMLTSLYEPFTPSPVQRDLGVTVRPLSATLMDSIEWYRTVSRVHGWQ